jgi:hypothetical protein
MMNATKKLSAGVYQIIGTDFAIRNDCRRCWWVVKVNDGLLYTSDAADESVRV